MSARDEILNAIRQGAVSGKAPALPPAWQSRRSYPDLGHQFLEAVRTGGGQAERAQTLDGALRIVQALLAEVAARTVVVNGGPAPLDGVDWPTRFPTAAWRVVGQHAGDLRAFCAAADVGISSAAVGLAETGTLVLTSGPARSRLATLLPPVHLALLPEERLTTDLFTWQEAQTGAPPSNITLVSGPSKTADIEQTLAVGMHGPRRLVVVLIAPEPGS